jgi:2-enoate reductase
MLKYPELFTPFYIGKVKIKNRIAMEPMRITGLGDKDEDYTSHVIRYYEDRARGGVGLIFTDAKMPLSHFQDYALGSPFDDPYNYQLTAKKLVERIHNHGTKVFEQLAFGPGRTSFPALIKNGSAPIAPSTIPNKWDLDLMCRPMTVEEIKQLIEDLAQEALICKNCGFDGVDIHSVYGGYLGDTFAMSYFNHRTDEYGSSLEGRLKLATDTVKRIKELCGNDFPVSLRFGIKHYMKGLNQGALPGEDFEEVGRDIDESIEAAKILKAAGYDALNIANGTYDSWYWCHPPMYQKDGCWLDTIAKLKKEVDITVIGAGKINLPETANNAIKNGVCDGIGLARALWADSDWAKKARKGATEEIRPCIGCHNGCMARIFSSKPVTCAVNPALGREQEYEIVPAQTKKHVCIIGAGVAGMETARIAALRGHTVDLFEKNDYLGGALYAASVPEFKDADRRLIRWYAKQLKDTGVNLHVNTEVSAETILSMDYDTVVVANGAKPKIPNVPGKEKAMTAVDVLLGKKTPGNNVAVIGGGQVGCELAVWLKERGKNITLIEALDDLMIGGVEELCIANRTMLIDMVNYNKIDVKLHTFLKSINDGSITVQDENGESSIPVDSVVVSVGYYPDQTLYDQLNAEVPELYSVGDQNKPTNILYAIGDGAAVGRDI